ncbi:sensor histidine kinase [Aliagarivorans taiwanensis]|uniref:sensor histidine kinase n=1 Tax=Aliagarivorans taiwanensis TaxID=561966 RepID=UPI0003FF9589|nr:HAMP domain-containing sensor histidine kinase [Aliagarivorans taiwanensis]
MSFTKFRPFYSKLVLAVLGCFTLVGGLLLGLGHKVSMDYQNEVEQKLHLDLAAYLVKESDLYRDGELNHAAITHAFHTMMILGPSFEFYILSPQGDLVTYSAKADKIKRQQVDLAPIQTFLSGDQAMPIVGDDPRSLTKQKIFSVAEIRNSQQQLVAYLYVIIGGEIYDDVAQLLQGSHILKLSSLALLGILGFSLLLVSLVFAFLTRPLRKLYDEMQQFQRQGLEQAALPENRWRPESGDEIQGLGDAFHQLAASLQEQYQKVKDTDQLRRELVSYVSHDLRTPLAALQGYLETWQLKHQQLDEQQSCQLITTAQANAERTSRLVEQLFELAHLDSADTSLNLEPMNVAELAFDVVQKLALQAEEAGVSLAVKAEPQQRLVSADIQRLERVFTNLLENAIRHSFKGGVITLEVTGDTDSDKVQVCVRDQGCGIPASDLPHIFDPHYRAANQVSDQRSHGGLGLAIVKRVIELHHSEITVHSRLGEGSAFVFQLNAV